MFELSRMTPRLLAAAEAEGGHHGPPFAIFWMVGLVVITIIALLFIGKKGYNARVFKNVISNCLEQIYRFLTGFADGIIGPHGRKYMTMLCTFWLFIFVSNIYGLFFDYTPTADFSLNLALAVCAVAYVQYEGIRANGVFGHLKHFSGPKLTGALVLVSGMIFLIEFVSEAMKLLSLSLRLYGNIHGGHEVVVNLNNLGHFHALGTEWSLPIGGLLLPIKLLTCIVQALVFTLLFSVYLGLVTHHEEEHHAPEGHAEPAHAT